MSLRQFLSEPEENQSNDNSGARSGFSPVLPLFRRIPPERIGLCGEYDYNGLSKRVEHCFRQHCCPDDLLGLRVSQRGAIVLLTGRFSSPQVKHELVALALGVDGAVGVEVNGETLFPPLRACGLSVPTSLHRAG
ncbi:phospholipid-binding protein [Thermoleptolyngbya sp.]